MQSTRNYTQYLIITYNGKESEKGKNMCAYPYPNYFAVHLKLTQYCKSTILQKKKNFKCCLCSEFKALKEINPQIPPGPWNKVLLGLENPVKNLTQVQE